MASAIFKVAGLKTFFAAPAADLLATYIERGAVGGDASGNECADVAVEVAPLCGTDGDLVGFGGLFLAGVVGEVAFTLDPLAGEEIAVVLDAADVERRIGFGTVAGTTLDGVVAGDEGFLRGLPGDRAGAGLIGRRRRRVGRRLLARGIFGIHDSTLTVAGGAAGTDPPSRCEVLDDTGSGGLQAGYGWTCGG